MIKMVKDMKNKNKKEQIIYSIILILFVFLTAFLSLKHEYWADEANTWLIARDGSLVSLFTKYLALNGHPFTFIGIIKLFQLFGLNYSNYHFISILFSSLGVAVFLFKSDYKWYIKILLPFTYFIFYQYTIITRGYSLLLFLFSLLAIIWEKRKEHYWLFTILLIILLNLESYTFLIAGSIYLLELINYFKNKEKKNTIPLIVLFLSFLLTTIYMLPKSTDTTFIAPKDLGIADAFIYSNTLPSIISILSTIIIICGTVYVYLKNKKKKELFETVIIFTPFYLFFSFFYCNYWHSGIILILFLFLCWIHKLESNIFIKVLLLITCLTQIFWSYKASINDYKYIYSPSKEVANYLKEYDYNNLKIFCNHYICSEINPYFEKNIFAMWTQEIAFYDEGNDNPNYLYDYETESILKDKPDILIIANSSNEEDINKSHHKYQDLENYYTLKTYKGNAYFKDTIIKIFNYDVYIKKELINET